MSNFHNQITISMLLVFSLGACQSLPPAPEIEQPPASVEQTPAVAEVIARVIDPDQESYQAAISVLKQNKMAAAIQQLEPLSIKSPDLKYIFTNLGLAHFNLKDYDKAQQAFQQAINRNDQDAVAYNHLGVIHRIQGKFEEANRAYQSAININSKYAQAHLNLGILYDIYLQDLKLALDQYQKYQALTNSEDKSVANWIVDIERRLKAGQG
jgi:tetratricopeptide (TPR) repeat protein